VGPVKGGKMKEKKRRKKNKISPEINVW